MAVGMGFGQLFRGIGQVSGVALGSALFQSLLDARLRERITGPDAEDVRIYSALSRNYLKISYQLILRIRHSTSIVRSLPPYLQHQARIAYALALRVVFIFAMFCTLTAFLVRLPVSDMARCRFTTRYLSMS